jgi:hypothetical protein
VIGTYTYFIYPAIRTTKVQTNKINCYIPSIGNYLDSNFIDMEFTWLYSEDAANRFAAYTDPDASTPPPAES